MIDILLAVILVGSLVMGFRRGFVVSAFSLLGFLGGGALAMWLLPALFDHWLGADTSGSSERSVLLVGGVLIAASLGQGLAVWAGGSLRDRVNFTSIVIVDAVLGAIASLVAVSILVWFVAGALREGSGSVSRDIGRSRVVQALDDVVPAQTSQLFSGFRSLLDQGGFPKVFESLGPEHILPVSPPDPSVVTTKAVAADAASIVKITGVARSCSRSQEGSGWVVAPDRVVTNAHVVAGERSEQVRIGGVGQSYLGHVVLFDSKRDIAILDVPGLPAPALHLGSNLARSDSAVVAGFPLDGPYHLDAARVRDVISATGADIYGRPGIVRQVYSLYTRIEPGNSGGPLLAPDGKVVGIVFAKSLDDAETGYALTIAEAAPVLAKAASSSTQVSTHGCAAG